ncbi:MAG: DUF3223 domain-containing protein [Burkholderiaceae bacterium]
MSQPKPAKFSIGGEPFDRLSDIEQRCRDIIGSMASGDLVGDQHQLFVLDLLRYHDEWSEKLDGDEPCIVKGISGHGTPCFFHRRPSGERIDISWVHARKCYAGVISGRPRDPLKSAMNDIQAAARAAIQPQIIEFRRDQAASRVTTCAKTGEVVDALNPKSSHVDHHDPHFDRLLYKFLAVEELNPLTIKIGSSDTKHGVAVFENKEIAQRWIDFHRQKANLRLLARRENLRDSFPPQPWELLTS